MTGNDSSPDWLQFVMSLDKLDPDTIEEIFNRHGACSVTLSDAGDNPVLEPAPGETPLWSDTCITGLFPADADMAGLKNGLRNALALEKLPQYRVERLVNRDWEREWLKDFGPMRFGERLWISPGDSTVTQQHAVIIRLDPGLAFGTGTHATTALCLEWLDGLDLAGRTLLDYGCGSGVLAIAGLKLGCASAVAMDIDPQALIATSQNAERNGVAGRLRVFASPEQVQGHFDIVVANILAGPLVEFAESVTSTVAGDGMLALSGVLCEQTAAVMAAYEPWIEFEEPVFREQDGQTWSRLTGKRR